MKVFQFFIGFLQCYNWEVDYGQLYGGGMRIRQCFYNTNYRYVVQLINLIYNLRDYWLIDSVLPFTSDDPSKLVILRTPIKIRPSNNTLRQFIYIKEPNTFCHVHFTVSSCLVTLQFEVFIDIQLRRSLTESGRSWGSYTTLAEVKYRPVNLWRRDIGPLVRETEHYSIRFQDSVRSGIPL